MTRPSLRRAPTMERLETRQVLSSLAGPSPDKQYALELINLARTNPAGAAERLTTVVDADVEATLASFRLNLGDLKTKIASVAVKPPLAYDDALDAAAQGQSQAQADMGKQTHQGADGRSFEQRLDSVGYTGRSSSGENAYAYADSIRDSMQAFLFDWGVPDNGHFRNILQPDKGTADAFSDVGIGIAKASNNGLGPLVVTQNFASQRGDKPQILGVAYEDSDRNQFYTPGEGKGGVTIDATNLTTGQKYSAQTWDSGGYQIPVDPGATYRVTETAGGMVLGTRELRVSDANEKVDFVQSVGNATTASPPGPASDRATAMTAEHVRAEQPASQPPVAPTTAAPAAPPMPSWLGKWSQWRAVKTA